MIRTISPVAYGRILQVVFNRKPHPPNSPRTIVLPGFARGLHPRARVLMHIHHMATFTVCPSAYPIYQASRIIPIPNSRHAWYRIPILSLKITQATMLGRTSIDRSWFSLRIPIVWPIRADDPNLSRLSSLHVVLTSWLFQTRNHVLPDE